MISGLPLHPGDALSKGVDNMLWVWEEWEPVSYGGLLLGSCSGSHPTNGSDTHKSVVWYCTGSLIQRAVVVNTIAEVALQDCVGLWAPKWYHPEDSARMSGLCTHLVIALPRETKVVHIYP